MGRIPDEIVNAVRDRTDIVAVISRHVTLKQKGSEHVGLCPFHKEKSPSFSVNQAKGMYYCRGCHKGGNVFSFLRDIEGLSFIEAVKELAGPAGVTIEDRELTVDERRSLRKRSTLLEVLEEAAQFYEATLWTHVDGQAGRDYLEKRGIDHGIARDARMGFAPEGWTRLLDHLHKHDFEASQVLEAGLARPRKQGDGHYDAFRGRLLFPIRDERNRVIGFGGRLLEGEGPKYINTPETKLYDKKRVLYGLEVARGAMQRADQAVIVEGYFDVLALRAAGHNEAVASCGTAITPEHVQRIKRLTNNVVLLTDGDRAGKKACEAALPLLVGAEMHAYRVELPDAKDPDEFVQAHGAEALTNALRQRQSLVEWVIEQKVLEYADQTALGAVSTTMARERILKELRHMLGSLPDRQLPRIAGLLRIPEVEIRRSIQHRADSTHVAPTVQGWRPAVDVVHVFWLLIHCYDKVADLLQRAPPAAFADHEPVQSALARLLTGEHPGTVMENEPDDGVRRTIAAVVAREKLYHANDASRVMCELLGKLSTPRLKARKHVLQHQLAEVQRSGDLSRLRAVLTESQDLSQSLDLLDASMVAEDFGTFVDELARVLESLGTTTPPPPPPAPAFVADDDPGPPADDSPFPTDDGWAPPEDDDEPPPWP